MTTLLHINASARDNASTTRQFSQRIVEALAGPETSVIKRDADARLPLLTDGMVEAYFTPADQRTEQQATLLALSDEITHELIHSDTLVIGIPIYNFSAPAAFKAWCDLAARVGVTFNYTDTGPEGLLQDKRAIVVINSGGTQVGGAMDFLSPWITHFLAFIGIADTTILTVDELERDFDGAIEPLLNERSAHAA